MKRFALLLSVVLLACSGVAKADGVSISYAIASLSSWQIEIEGVGLPVVPTAGLIPTATPSATMLLGMTPSPYIPLNPCLGLLGGAHVQPTPTPSLIGAQTSMALASVRHDVAMAVIRNMR